MTATPPPTHVLATIHPAQRPPGPGEQRPAELVEWQTYDGTFLRNLPVTLKDLEEFARQCRVKGAPDEALVTGLENPACKWYGEPVPEPPPFEELLAGLVQVTPIPDRHVPPTEDMAFWIDNEGDIWFEREPDSFTLWQPSIQAWSGGTYVDCTLDEVIDSYMGWPTYRKDWVAA